MQNVAYKPPPGKAEVRNLTNDYHKGKGTKVKLRSTVKYCTNSRNLSFLYLCYAAVGDSDNNKSLKVSSHI
ncbi:unnamed protein product [Soboliphyme baturini]|uniref:Ovule protein n=1 Tax=Soboliphyme baturini TaxID=241478 RepID=A0A183IT06_9BILA|nr:unnamed protein product [Soboliphyme baturini]